MLKITLINYPPEATSSSIEIVPQAELPAIEHFWVSEMPIDEPHVFSIDRSFYPLQVSLFIIQAGYELLYMVQGTQPEEPNYEEILFDCRGSFSCSFAYDVGNDIWRPAMSWVQVVVVAAVCAGAVYLTIEGIQQSKRRPAR